MRIRMVLAAATILACTSAVLAAKVEVAKPISPSHSGIGRWVPDWTGTTSTGEAFSLAKAAKGKKGTVIAVASVHCPLSKKYQPTLVKLEADYAKKDIAFVVVDPIATDSAEDLKSFAGELKATLLLDKDGTFCKTLGAISTTDLFVLDSARTIVYRGAVDDQYGLGYSTDAPKKTFAKDAIEAVLAGERPKITATSAPGCALDLASAKPLAQKPTYHNRISRLVQQHCLECHRKGGVGPFDLSTSEAVLAQKGMIKKVVDDGRMPPWFAAEPKPGEHRPFRNDRSLTEADKKDFLAWFADGTPMGEESEAPLARKFGEEWSIGKPDLVVQIPKPIQVKATGIMDYEEIIVDSGTTEEKWVTAAEVRPTDRSVVHHVLVFALPAKKAGDLELPRRGEGQGYFAAYVPGNGFQILPEGFGRKLPKGARLKFQIHYTPNGKKTEDQVRVGFRFASKTPEHEIRVLPLGNPKISIPPGASDHPEQAEYKLPVEAMITAFSPHMHVRGKTCKYEIDTKDGTKVLLEVPHFDFNWQLRYELSEPVRIEKNTTARFLATFDNSTGNPANPDPKATVTWGQQTADEMLLGYVEFYIPGGAFALPAKPKEKKSDKP